MADAALCAWNRPLERGVDSRRHGQRTSERLECAFGSMMVVEAGHQPDVQTQARLERQALEEMPNHLAGQLADPLARERKVDHGVASSSEIERDQRERLIKGNDRMRHAHDPGPIAKRLIEGLTDANPNVFNGVMRVPVDIAHRLHRKIKTTVAGDLLQEMIEHPNSRIGLPLTAAIEIQGNVYARFSCFSIDLGATGHG